MKAYELIDILSRYPEYDVEVYTETMITPLMTVERDCLDTEQGLIFLLIPDLEEN